MLKIESISPPLRLQRKSKVCTIILIIGFCIDDPTPPYKGVKGKGMAVIQKDIAYNKDIIKKFVDSIVVGSNHPISKFMLSQIESGSNIISRPN
jgi:hypothetical protein